MTLRGATHSFTPLHQTYRTALPLFLPSQTTIRLDMQDFAPRFSRTLSKTVLALVCGMTLVACGGGDSSEGGTSQPFSIDGARVPDSPAAMPRLPPTEVANAVGGGPVSPEAAYRVLDQGTFGPTLDDIHSVAASGFEPWIDAQMSTPAALMLPALLESGNQRWNEYINVWWRRVVTAPDQLRQRVAFALSEILVVSSVGSLGEHQPGLMNYYDILLRNAFGNYRDLLQEITLSPVMGEYLSMKGNRRADPDENIRPDENFARELMQLFSIGLEKLNPDGTPKLDADGVPLPTFDQEVIENYARVFTGWHFANADNFRWSKQKDYVSPMQPWQEFHDTDAKTLHDGIRLPAGQSAEQDISDALDALFAHPNVGPFVVRHLIRRLVTSNPSPGYVKDVAAVFDSNATGERGSLASTVKAILMHREARVGHLDDPDRYGKLREPLLRISKLWRAFGVTRLHPQFNYSWAGNELGQAPMSSATVFNFFRDDFSQPGALSDAGLVSPEFEITDESSIVSLTSRLLANTLWSHNHKSDADELAANIDIDRELILEPDPEALLDHLDLLLLGGRMSDGLREEARNLMAARSYTNGAAQRVVEAIFLLVTSPQAAVQQ